MGPHLFHEVDDLRAPGSAKASDGGTLLFGADKIINSMLIHPLDVE